MGPRNIRNKTVSAKSENDDKKSAPARKDDLNEAADDAKTRTINRRSVKPVTSAKQDSSNNSLNESGGGDTSITQGRAKRTPKPNRKYMNYDIVPLAANKSGSNSPQPATTEDEDGNQSDDAYEAPAQNSAGKRKSGPQVVISKISAEKIESAKKAMSRLKRDGTTTIKSSPAQKLNNVEPGMKRKLTENDLDKDDKLSPNQRIRKRVRQASETNTTTEDDEDNKDDSGSGPARQLRSRKKDEPETKQVIANRVKVLGKKDPIAIKRIIGKNDPKSPINLNDSDVELSLLDGNSSTPTFTIKNIDDLISKDGVRLTRNRQKKFSQSDTEENNEENEAPKNSSLTVQPRNRRKAVHTVLSDKITTVSTKPKKDSAQQSVGRSNATSILRKPVEENGKLKPNIISQQPRILNSTVGRSILPARPMGSIVTKLVSKDINKVNLNSQSQITKPKINTQSVLINRTKPVVTNASVSPQQRGELAIRRLKRITCFEKWYVINIPPDQSAPKSVLLFSMIKLGNNIKEINLPSPEWSYKLTLQLLPNKKASDPPVNNNNTNKYDGSKGKMVKSNVEVYSGEVQDANIRAEDKHNYHPVIIAFSRMNSKNQLDRVVVFKNRTFFTVINGKNVKLIGTPSHISSLEDIQILLEIVNELDLKHSCVEPIMVN